MFSVIVTRIIIALFRANKFAKLRLCIALVHDSHKSKRFQEKGLSVFSDKSRFSQSPYGAKLFKLLSRHCEPDETQKNYEEKV